MKFRFGFLCFCLFLIGHTWSAPKRDIRMGTWLFASGMRKVQICKRTLVNLRPRVKLFERHYINNYPVAFYVCSNCSDGQDYTGCIVGDCRSQQCADFVVGPNDWCAKCPNGPNCWVENRLIPMGNVESFPNGTTCNCIYGIYQVVRTQCSYLLDGVAVDYFHGPDYVSWM
ncbi:brorin-like isoform X3 [Biomphalaria glabrata]